MAHISPKIIQEVKSRNRLEDVLRSYGVELDSRNKALCPFHKEKTPSFSVKPEEQIFTCFGKCNFALLDCSIIGRSVSRGCDE